MNRTIIGIGAHADDVEIHFGGTLLKYMDQGYTIVYVQSTNNMSGGIRRRQPDGSWKKTVYPPDVTMKYRREECDAAAAVFKTTPIHLDHPQRHYDLGTGERLTLHYTTPAPENVPMDRPTILTAAEDPESVKRVTDLILEHDPEAIFTHGLAEVNPEHTGTAVLVIRAYWKALSAGFQGSLLHDVNRFDGEFGPFNSQWQTWVDVSDFVDRRMAVLQKHASQYPPDFEQGVTYWKEYLEDRGGDCGTGAAEVFNFLNDPTPDTGGPLTEELVRNRAKPGTVWSARSRKRFSSD